MEEPTERLKCKRKILVKECMDVLNKLLDDYRIEIYKYNTIIKNTGYYLKPVHKVYYRNNEGTKTIYEYYGVYWWKKEKKGYKTYLRYFGKNKPKGLPEPPFHPVQGVVANKEEGWFIITVELFKNKFEELKKCKISCLD